MVFKYFPEGFSPGSVVAVKGYVHSDPDRFEINLQSGPVVSPDIVGDIALHFNPRFDEDIPVIVRNTKSNGQWGYEERDGGFFFRPNQNIFIQIHSEHRGYKRLEDEFDVPKPPAPYKLSLEDCLKPGCSLEIKGKTRGDASRFSVNLVCGKNPEHNYDICCPITVALHYDVRFYPSNLIVRNTMIEGEWGDEETDECFTFSQDSEFALRFDCKEEHFQIYVNRVLTSTYRHRISPLNISYIYIHGGICLFEVNMTNL